MPSMACCTCTYPMLLCPSPQLKKQQKVVNVVEKRKMEREQRIRSNLEPQRVSMLSQIEACNGSNSNTDGTSDARPPARLQW